MRSVGSFLIGRQKEIIGMLKAGGLGQGNLRSKPSREDVVASNSGFCDSSQTILPTFPKSWKKTDELKFFVEKNGKVEPEAAQAMDKIGKSEKKSKNPVDQKKSENEEPPKKKQKPAAKCVPPGLPRLSMLKSQHLKSEKIVEWIESEEQARSLASYLGLKETFFSSSQGRGEDSQGQEDKESQTDAFFLNLGVLMEDGSTNCRLPKEVKLRRNAASVFRERFPKPLVWVLKAKKDGLEKVYILPHALRGNRLLVFSLLHPETRNAHAAVLGFNLAELLREFSVDPMTNLAAEITNLELLDPGLMLWLLDASLGEKCYDLDFVFTEVLKRDIHNRSSGDAFALLVDEDLDTLSDLVKLIREDFGGKGLQKVLMEQELPLANLLSSLTVSGAPFDESVLKEWQCQLKDGQACLELKAQKLAGRDFLLTSPEQVSNVLFDVLKLEVPPSVASRAPPTKKFLSTSDEVLESLEGAHEIVALIRQHRKISKILNTYVDTLRALPGKRRVYFRDEDSWEGVVEGEEIEKVDMASYFSNSLPARKEGPSSSLPRIFSNWNQTMTITGRLSSSNPNLQNIPQPKEFSELGILNVRSAFKPPSPGHVLVGADYSQVEVRVLAHFVGPGKLRESFLNGKEDIYREMAGVFLNKPSTEISSRERKNAKTCCLALMYGSGIQNLARQMGTSKEEAASFRKQFLKTFPEITAWMEEVYREVGKTGFVSTLTGRRRLIPDRARGAEGRRLAVNTIIQGTAADILKRAMIRASREISSNMELWSRVPLSEQGQEVIDSPELLMTIHDELLFSCNRRDVRKFAALLKDSMTEGQDLGFDEVPLVTVVKVGDDWGNLQTFECDSAVVGA